jgi:hypothetical protein
MRADLLFSTNHSKPQHSQLVLPDYCFFNDHCSSNGNGQITVSIQAILNKNLCARVSMPPYLFQQKT